MGWRGFAGGAARRAWRTLPAEVRRSRMMRPVRRRALEASGVRIVQTLVQVDAVLAKLATTDSYDEHKRIFESFRMLVARDGGLDPHSPAYRERELRIYEWISGRHYEPANEVTTLDVRDAARRPYPYFTRSAAAVGNQLMAIGFLIKALDVPPGGRILELGAGWGNLTVALARTGYDVVAIDVASDFLSVVGERASQEACSVRLVRGDFSAVCELDETFDAVVFFESFHHCLDHAALVRELDRVVRAGGRIVFGAEPIFEDFEVPWGMRLDGESLWAIRRNGWLELGFRESYFREMLRRAGWGVHKLVCPDTPWGVVFVARRLR